MFRLVSLLLDLFAEDIPPESAACGDCNETTCSNERWKGCARRLAAIESANGGGE